MKKSKLTILRLFFSELGLTVVTELSSAYKNVHNEV